MDQDLSAIRQHLGRLGARERRLLAGRAVLQVLAAGLGVAVIAALLLSAGVARVTALGVVTALGGVSLWLGFALPLIGRWAAAGDPVRQAAAVERLVPELRSRLLTALERAPEVESGKARFSVALLARAVASARALTVEVEPAQVHPTRQLRRPGGLALVAALAALLASVALPIGPGAALAALWTGNTATARLESAEPAPADERALVGDIVLRYVFPDYTGQAPLEIPNSDGTIHAPPGTEVTISARTAEPFEAAALQAYDRAPVDAELTGGRDLRATLRVEGEGTWRFLLFRGRTATRSADFRIEVEADAPPVVAANQNRLELAVDQPLGLGWQASDDYGVEKVVLEVEIEGKVHEVLLRDPLDTPLSVAGDANKTAREIGLRPGDEAILRVVAYDNDPVAGSKRGSSPNIPVTVSGPRGRGARLAQYHLALRDALLVTLADFLEDPMPPGDDNAAFAKWGEVAMPRFDRVREIVEGQWGQDTPTGIDGTVVSRVLETAARLFRFTQTAFDPASEHPPAERDVLTFVDLHGQEVASLELAVWILDSLLRQDALSRVAEHAEGVAGEAKELTELLETDASAAEMLSRLDQLERQMRRLMEDARALGEGQLREFVNSRTRESMDLISEIRKAISEGRMDEAKEMMSRLADMLQQMSDGLNDQLAASQETDDALRERMAQLSDDLEKLEQDQVKLADEMAAARQQEGAGFQKMMGAWDKLDPLAERARALGCGAAARPGAGDGWRTGTIRKLGQLCGALEDLQGAVRARDAAGALKRVGESELQQRLARDQVDNEGRRPRTAADPPPPEVALALGDVDNVKPVLSDMRRILDALSRQNVSMSPEMQRKARELAQKQQELSAREQKLSEDVKAAERAMPTGDGSAQRAMEQAGQGMEDARDALARGDGLGGEGHQRYAAGQVAEARRVLERQQQEAQQMQQAMAAMRGQGSQQRGGKNGNEPQQASSHQIEIPAPESFQTPEAYRRALLEGMEAEVPDEYRALKQRYYEELVRQ